MLMLPLARGGVPGVSGVAGAAVSSGSSASTTWTGAVAVRSRGASDAGGRQSPSQSRGSIPGFASTSGVRAAGRVAKVHVKVDVPAGSGDRLAVEQSALPAT